MSLPRLDIPLFDLIIPSTGQSITYRPFLVKEEKILLIAKEGDDEDGMLRATLQVIESCTNGEIDINSLTSFDIEYLFLNIRAKSVGEVIELRYKHTGDVNREGENCSAVTTVSVNIEDIKVVTPENHDKKIMITDDVGVQMKYPQPKVYESIQESSTKATVEGIVDCIDYLFDKEQIYDATTTTREEMIQFVENMKTDQLNKIGQFFESMPVLQYETEYTCAGCGQVDKLNLKGLTDFF